jgi:hypothetical protein
MIGASPWYDPNLDRNYGFALCALPSGDFKSNQARGWFFCMDEGVSFGDFVGEEVIASNSPRSVLKRAFGSFEDSVDCSVPLRAPDFPLSWVTRLDSAVMKRGGIAETLLLQAVGVRNNESEGRTKSNNNDCCLTLIDRLRVLKVVRKIFFFFFLWLIFLFS